jgi:hypothetical protein
LRFQAGSLLHSLWKRDLSVSFGKLLHYSFQHCFSARYTDTIMKMMTSFRHLEEIAGSPKPVFGE